MPYSYEYPRPAVTVDVAVLWEKEILLIKRGKPPFKGAWALPGGFLDMDEELKQAAARELEEETGLQNIPMKQVGVFDKIGRDPRGRTITVAYLAILDTKPRTRAGDDAVHAAWFPLDGLPSLAFDHIDIISRLKDQWEP